MLEFLCIFCRSGSTSLQYTNAAAYRYAAQPLQALWPARPTFQNADLTDADLTNANLEVLISQGSTSPAPRWLPADSPYFIFRSLAPA